MENTATIRFAERMSQLPPYLFGMINKMMMERRWNGEDVIDLGMGNPMDPCCSVSRVRGKQRSSFR